MYGTQSNRLRDIFEEDKETVLETENVTIKDVNNLLQDIIEIGEEASVLSGGIDISFNAKPLNMFNEILVRHIEQIELIKEKIKKFEKKNRLVIEKIKEEKDKEKELEKKVKEETKPKRRKTVLL